MNRFISIILTAGVLYSVYTLYMYRRSAGQIRCMRQSSSISKRLVTTTGNSVANSWNDSSSQRYATSSVPQSLASHTGQSSQVIVFTIMQNASQIKQLREFVGSLHRINNDSKIGQIMVIDMSNSESLAEEVNLWANVNYLTPRQFGLWASTDDHVLYDAIEQHKLSVKQQQWYQYTRLLAFQYLFTRYGDNVVYADVSLKLDKNLVDQIIQSLNKVGGIAQSSQQQFQESVHVLGLNRRSSFAKHIVYDRITCLSTLECSLNDLSWNNNANYMAKLDSVSITDLNQEGFKTEGQDFCNIQIRADYMYTYARSLVRNKFIKLPHSKADYIDRRKVIALGVPTKSSCNNGQISPVISIFMPSLLASIDPSEPSQFKFIVYILFDKGDCIFDTNSAMYENVTSAIDQMINDSALQDSLVVRYLPMPRSNGWLTLIWNIGFLVSMQEGADYYYQVNDDLKIETAGWASYFTTQLDVNEGLGVAGPSDAKWKCSLLTQAMVSRRHFDIFGFFFPLEIKDWYSDFWITRLYEPKHKYCSQEVIANNLQNQGVRYARCNGVNWFNLVQRDKKIVKAHQQAISQF
ncbi:hypothetical protein MP228_010260 [Amoeboaphelidium protococcarum]|nr:hypothetical protein MP228_010260 [Amoeboaphelidium protococcarum]